jgi:two-component system LytT family response regulator
MRKYTVFVIEDEPLAEELIIHNINRLKPSLQYIGSANNLEDGLKFLSQLKPDILILDLMVKGDFGLDVTKTGDFLGEIIVVSAYDEYGIIAIKHNVCDYLLKPLNFKEFEQAISKAKERLNKEDIDHGTDRIVVHDKNGMMVLGSADILYCEADGNYTKVHTVYKVYLIPSRIGDLQKVLSSNLFIRIHRSFIVNINQIDLLLKYNKGLVLKSGLILPTTRGFKL